MSMARPTKIESEDLLDAARAVFLIKGPAATTADVAKRAKVSEGTLFKRFKSKEELFRQALQPTRAIPDVIERLPNMAGKGELKDNLVSLSLELIEVFEVIMPLMILGYGHDRESPEQPGPMRASMHLARFFEGEMRLGRMRKLEAEHTALVFLGAIINYVMTFRVMPNPRTLPIPPESFVRGMVHLMWEGLAPK